MLLITRSLLGHCRYTVLYIIRVVCLCFFSQCISAQNSINKKSPTEIVIANQQGSSCSISPRMAYKSIISQTKASHKHQETLSKTNSHSSMHININTATEAELVVLPRIGVKKAQAIIAYRKQNGSFKSVYELTNIKGIGKKTVMNFADKITIQ